MTSELVTTGWTQFWDMHSGGGTKEDPYNLIYIQAPQAQAELIFYKRFGHSPYRVSCTCCGADYSVEEGPDLAQVSAYHRNCGYDNVAGKWIEERDRESDKIILDIASRMADPKIKKLVAMAKDKSSPKEAAIALDKLVSMDVPGMWSPSPHIPLEEFIATGNGKRGDKAMFIPFGDITAEEWAYARSGAELPEEGYVWR